jgi:multidrug efflux pump subunit AcrA (membrane-fusion protein)
MEVNREHRLLVAGRQHAAVVTAVLPEVDSATRTRRVVLSFDAGSVGRVLPGQVARLEVVEKVSEPGYWLPAAALVRGSRGLWSCLAVIQDEQRADIGRVEKRDLEVLHTEGARVLARGTLQPGDRIVAGGTHRVVSGQLVRAVRPDEEVTAQLSPSAEARNLL